MDIVDSTLISFGLTDSEAQVYRHILREHETNPYAIAKATGIPRTTVYELLTNLSFKELIELKRSDGISKQQTRIIAKDPSYIRTIIRNRRNALARMDAEVVHILPMLKKDYIPGEPNADFQFFSGIEGAKNVFLDACLDDVDLPEIVYNYKIADDAFGREVINTIVEKENSRTRKNIPKEILPLNDWTKHCLTYHFERDPRYVDSNHMRYIDQQGFDLTSRISVKGTRVWIVSVEGDECWGKNEKSDFFPKPYGDFSGTMVFRNTNNCRSSHKVGT